MDRRNLEPCHRLHKDHSRVRFLLCGTVFRTLSKCLAQSVCAWLRPYTEARASHATATLAAKRPDASLPRGRAVEKLFRDNLAMVGSFDFVVSTKIDRPTADRPHFFIAYG